jgi:hypothetical protein
MNNDPGGVVKGAHAQASPEDPFLRLPVSGWTTSRTLRPSPLTPAVGRRLARESCRERSVCRAVAARVEMATGEMVSLSVQQARSPLTLTIVIDGQDVAIEVLDGGQRLPTEGGGRRGARQIHTLERLADSWGFDRLGAGRRLWSHITARPPHEEPDHPSTRQVALP